jgi:hypothetical protein
VADPRTLRDIAVAALANTVDRAVLEKPELRAVALALERMGDLAWPAALQQVRADPQPVDQPLLSLAGTIGLSDVELLAVALTSAVEEDMLVGRAVAFVQTPVGASRPTLGLLSAAYAPVAAADRRGRRTLEDLWHGNAVGSGLLYVLNEGLPMAECPAGVPHYLCLALAGFDAAPANTEIGLPLAADVPLPESLRASGRGTG